MRHMCSANQVVGSVASPVCLETSTFEEMVRYASETITQTLAVFLLKLSHPSLKQIPFTSTTIKSLEIPIHRSFVTLSACTKCVDIFYWSQENLKNTQNHLPGSLVISQHSLHCLSFYDSTFSPFELIAAALSHLSPTLSGIVSASTMLWRCTKILPWPEFSWETHQRNVIITHSVENWQ